jgi:hypothetical protein
MSYGGAGVNSKMILIIPVMFLIFITAIIFFSDFSKISIFTGNTAITDPSNTMWSWAPIVAFGFGCGFVLWIVKVTERR